MKKRAEKIKDAEVLRKALSDSQHIFLAGFQKMTVDQDFQLRKAVRAAGGNYKVIKNNVAQKASEGLGASDLFTGLAGMTSMVYTSSDPVAVAKALTAYAKANPSFTFKAGMVEGRVINVKEIQDLSSMPSKEELYAKILWLINSPAQRLVTAMNGVGRNLAVVIDQGVKENKFQS
jgi:large subunit ribosomal protein L10